ncbi:hypothetical protein BGP78_02155 [Pseudoalteromonas sp. MSK9-3]|uniref:ankyrin repeat domain-containing protein n=1 Tax=Pseudoalteromonas sp. MSK9-3 TaxID=1897633 RepID=UPI000E6D155A|nr:ankyrin repeat domain-containing protein [Pseudoalteromonas sp. MSK9-3]RJE75546.1 hypothetical protein BGP78_02155 [Pseudoalteromonas sp. MSK9-3]
MFKFSFSLFVLIIFYNGNSYASASTHHVLLDEVEMKFTQFFQGAKSLVKQGENCDYSARLDPISNQLELLKNDPRELIDRHIKQGENIAYSQFLDGMEIWSLYNLDDYKDYHSFLQTKAELIDVLSRYYQKKMGYKREVAAKISEEAINIVITSNLNAFTRDTMHNQQLYILRKLILSSGALSEIQQFKDKNALKDSQSTYEDDDSFIDEESILSIAVEYPEALKHLLNIGFDPNHKNRFNKTPLMYAVQKNQYQAVALLLEYGADVNAKTKKLNYQGCGYYQISQYDVSVLHYAARFASLDIIELLVEKGALKTVTNGVQLPLKGVPYKGPNSGRNIHNIPSDIPYVWLTHFRPEASNEMKAALSVKDIKPDGRLVKTLSNLKRRTNNLIKEEGNCGSAHYVDWRKDSVSSAISKLPFQLASTQGDSYSTGGSSFESDYAFLDIWALQGVSEHASFNKYITEVEVAISEVARYYESRFELSVEDAKEKASLAVKQAVSSGVYFSTYNPYNTSEEVALRRAILLRQPMAKIRKINISKVQKRNDNKLKESVLNVAIIYPEALQYLLESGFDPNSANMFGKTALMYAAQNNNLEAVKMLLAAGADVNAGTIIPTDDCLFTLSTDNMSALHYAVRYASIEVIKLLVSEGAKKHHNAIDRSKGAERIEYPIDWLSKFENNYLTKADKNELVTLLGLPSPGKVADIAKKLNLKGEQLFSKKSYDAAASVFKEAVEYQPYNARALNNYALTLMKLGKFNEALLIIRRVIFDFDTPVKEKASAYFNMALVCQSEGYTQVSGFSFCTRAPLELFIQSYEIYPTTYRAKKVLKVFSLQAKSGSTCTLQDGVYQGYFKKAGKLHLLHKADLPAQFSALAIQETQSINANLTLQDSIFLVDNYKVSTFMVDVSNSPIQLKAQECAKTVLR